MKFGHTSMSTVYDPDFEDTRSESTLIRTVYNLS